MLPTTWAPRWGQPSQESSSSRFSASGRRLCCWPASKLRRRLFSCVIDSTATGSSRAALSEAFLPTRMLMHDGGARKFNQDKCVFN